MLCILYVIGISTGLGLAGLLIERALPSTWQRRWIWCVLIPVSLFLPGVYRTQHTWAVNDVLEQPTVQSTIGQAFGAQERTGRIINRVWLPSSGLLILWALGNALRVSLLMHRSRRGRNGPGAMVDGVPVLVTDSTGPATVGVWRSRVLLPRWVLALPSAQRQYVVRHEEEHRRANDARLLFVASLGLILVPWNIGLWWLLRRLRLAVEMDCDNRVVAALGNPTAYGELLFRVAQASSRGPRLQPAFLGGVGMLERRLTSLLAPTPLRHVQRFLLPAVALGILLVVLSTPHPVLAPQSHGSVTMTSGGTTVAHTHSATE